MKSSVCKDVEHLLFIFLHSNEWFPSEKESVGGCTTLQLVARLGCDEKYVVQDDISSKDMNLMYKPTVEHGDNQNSCGRKVNSSELSSSQTTRNDSEFQRGSMEIAGRIYRCEMFSKYFPEKMKLINHQWVHTSEHTFECEICNKLFSHKGGLNKHLHLHTGDKHYKYNSCSKRFTEKSHLNRHQRTHTGERLIKYEICGNLFTQKGSLDSH
jgi:uncharacterized Zn-finger protein